MQVSAELRWFWKDDAPSSVEEWFHGCTRPPAGGGGRPRVDIYVLDPGQPELGLKRRGFKAGVEVKGLVAVLPSDVPVGQIEIWTKWTSLALHVDALPSVTTEKTRWLRKFDATGSVLQEVELDEEELPKQKNVSLPKCGCNVEFTRVFLKAAETTWWTLGFESFGSLATVKETLRQTIHHLKLDTAVISGALESSYPAWLSRAVAPGD
jgi:hypothetical protein